MEKVSIIIPAYNEEKTIEKVLNKVLRQERVGEIIVIDDGSKDKTVEIVEKKVKKSKKVKLIKHKTNYGKGRSIRDGFKKASFKYLLVQDADLEYDPAKNYKNLFKKMDLNKVVYGTRLKSPQNKHAYTRTYLGNIFITTLGNILFNINLSDSYTCYKLIPKNIVNKLNLKSNRFEIEAEITGKLAKKGVPIIEVPITYTPRTYSQGKKIKLKDALLGAITYLKVRLNTI